MTDVMIPVDSLLNLNIFTDASLGIERELRDLQEPEAEGPSQTKPISKRTKSAHLKNAYCSNCCSQMNDLLGGAPASKRSARYKADYDDDEGDIEEGGPPPPPPTEGDQSMQKFFATVEELKADMATIRGLQKEVVDLNEKGKTIVKTKEVQKHQEAMQVRSPPKAWVEEPA